MFPKILLLAAAAMFGAFGLLFVLAPDKLDEWIGISASRAEARTELRAFYGGLELGLAVFFVLCALRAPWTAAGCLALAIVNLGIGAARLSGFVLDGSASPKMLAFLATEVVLAILGLWAMRTAGAAGG